MVLLHKVIKNVIASTIFPAAAIIPDKVIFPRDAYTNSTSYASIVSPHDASGIFFDSFAAVGDSYASGLGAGYVSDRRCRRYDHSYPYLLNIDPRLGNQQEGNRRFEPLACAGARIGDVLDRQIPQLATTNYDLITVTAGGNDVGFGKIVDTCIFNLGTTPCERKVVGARAYATDTLPESLDMLLYKLKTKLTPKSGRIYITGYAKFFNVDTNQCNFASLAVIGKRTLDHYRRQEYNDLIDLVNAKIKEAAERAGPQVTFVDFDPYFGHCEGRICEAGVFEPNVHRARLLFFQRGSMDIDIREDGPSPIAKRKLAAKGDSIFRLPDYDLRIFHPRSTGHRIITDAIVAHMHRDKALAMGEKNSALDDIICPLRKSI